MLGDVKMNRRIEILIDNVKDLSKRVYRWFRSPVFRVHVMKFVATGLSVTLLVTAYMVHISYAEEYVAFQAITTTANLRRDVSRGVVYDRFGEPLITNNAVRVITYRHVPNTSVNEMRRVATYLADLIELDYETVLTHPRDRKDLFIMLFPAEARELVPVDEQSPDNAIFNQQMIDRIEDVHLEQLTEDQLRAHAIFMRMYQGAGTTTNIIKENPTEIEIARITEHLSHLPGIDIGVDWEREYPSDLSRDFFGHVSTHQQGIPRDREPYFLSQGYAANARVGLSQLELALHSYLSGFQYRYFVDDGVPMQLSQGLPGFNVSLNLDTELQLTVEEIVSNQLLENRRLYPQHSRFLRDAYVVVNDPNTGAVLAMVGVILDEENGVFTPRMHPLGTVQNASSVGSSVKGASLMAGYHYGVTWPGHSRHDRTLHFRGSQPIGSWIDMGWINDTTAIMRSSNVYFFLQSMELAGIHHWSVDDIIPFAEDNEAWDLYLNFFSQLGLGSLTGIEIPNESTGFAGSRRFHEFLFFSIGETDTYTAMQLAQFGSVIATRGNRMQMQLIQNIYMPSGGSEGNQLIRAFQPNVLNRIELTDHQWDTLHSGHRQVITHSLGTAHSVFRGVEFSPAGKTGTSEDYLRNEYGHIIDEHGRPIASTRIYNRSFFAYAPHDNPEIVVSVIVPQAQVAGMTRGPDNIAAVIARDVMQAYFDLQLARANER